MDSNEFFTAMVIDGRYLLKEYKGRGSFGEVWLAEDTELCIDVAIKLYISLDQNGQNEFKNEFKVAYGLSHENLLTTQHYGVWNNHPYLIMKYCSNGSADDIVGNATESQIWKFIHDVANGLRYLHAQEPPIIHQDIKPGNILIDDDGSFLITDFGISRRMRSTLRKQSNSALSGAVAYMGPERFSKEPMAVKASDIWSFGVSIYELATNDLPFMGQGGGMLNVGAEIPNLDTTKWSSSLNDVMRRCLSKNTWDRPTAEDLVEYSKLVLNGDKRTWSQWKGCDNPKPAPKPRMSLLTVWGMLLGGMSAIAICYFILARLFHNDYAPTVDDFNIGPIGSSVYDTHVTNLSLSGTANCYIVSSAGRYKFKIVKGNSTESVGSVVYSEVLWESFGTDETPAVGDLVSNVSYNDGYIEFDATGRKGNAVIAAKDAEGEILWSWHIWLTDMPEEQVYFNNAGTMMDRNLGATSATPGDVRALGLLYQWGRKDPFLGASNIDSENVAHSTLSWPNAVNSTSTIGTIEYTVAHPTIFIIGNNNNYDWYYSGNSYTDDTRWGEYKTMYDPCPVGWSIPHGNLSGVWSTALATHYWENPNNWDATNKGMDFSQTDKKLSDDAHVWYPASGLIDYKKGILYGVGAVGAYWSNSCRSKNADNLFIDGLGCIHPSNQSLRSGGQSIRCIKNELKDLSVCCDSTAVAE